MAFLTGCGSSNQAAASTQAPVEASQGFQQQSSTIVDNRKKSEDTAASFTEADFSTKEYLYENSIGDSLYYVIVTNNSRATVEVSGNATAKDGSGNAIGAGKMSIDVLGPGETSIGYFYFDSVSNISSVDYLLSYSPVRYYKPVISNLSVNQVLNDQNVTVTVTNTGEINAQFVQAYALFFDAADHVIAQSSAYITDNDSEIKPGATLSAQLDIYGKQYDHAEVYFTGRSDGSSSQATNSVSEADFDVTEKKWENSIGDTLWFLVVKNNSEYDVGIKANGTAYDQSGNVLGASNASIDAIGADQTSICYFYFDGVNGIDHVDYQLSFDTNLYYEDVIHNLSSSATINDSNVVVAVTNNGDKSADFVQIYALFLDAQGNIVAYDSTYVTDNDSEIKPGVTLTEQLTVYGKSFDTVELYFTGRHDQW